MSSDGEVEVTMGWVWTLIAGAFGVCLAGMLLYAYYENKRLDAQAPIVETCVHHRLTQKVVVQDL